MTVQGKLELTIKINSLPTSKTIKHGWQIIDLDCDGRIVTITLKPKVWQKIVDANTNFPYWNATISGKMGRQTPKGFELENPGVQVFEKKPKEA